MRSMLQFIHDNLEHVLCIAILVGRVGDIGSTYLITPRLKLEMNPVARRLRWPFALATLALCLVPYWNTAFAVPILVASLLVSALNLRAAWFARALGEERLLAMYLQAAVESRRWKALACVWASALFIVLAGLVLLVFYPRAQDWGLWYALGVVALGLVLGIHGTLFVRRIFLGAEATGR